MAKFTKTVGFIGAGHMAISLASGFLNRKIVEPQQLFASDIYPPSLDRFVKITGATPLNGGHEVVEKSDVVFLCVKPYQISSLLADLSKHPGIHSRFTDRLWISIAAGVMLSTYEKFLGKSARMVRVMPNTPCQVGQAATGVCFSPTVTAEDTEIVHTLFDTVGLTVIIQESQMDALTGLSGSGPAFVFIMMEAFIDAGVKLGLPRDTATKLAAQTMKGAAEMVLRTGENPAVLKGRVTSPAGTTIEGVCELERLGVRHAIMSAVIAAAQRSEELSKF